MNNIDQLEWTTVTPYQKFFDFIAPDADRYAILLQLLGELQLNSAAISIEEGRHFFVFPGKYDLKLFTAGTIPFKGQSPVILSAHYDRVEGSPGANDNSAAVFQLLKAALALEKQKADNWIIIFTDKEELKPGESVQNQGSFGLAKKLAEWGLGEANVFIFDACGSGGSLVLSNTTDYLLRRDMKANAAGTAGTNAITRLAALRDHALTTAKKGNFEKILLVPTPFSDDAGFLRAGLLAQVVTMLPANEAHSYESLAQSRPNLAEPLIAGAFLTGLDRLLVPETWRYINGAEDTHLHLTPEHFENIVNFAVGLCR